jgi:hypothetical protein
LATWLTVIPFEQKKKKVWTEDVNVFWVRWWMQVTVFSFCWFTVIWRRVRSHCCHTPFTLSYVMDKLHSVIELHLKTDFQSNWRSKRMLPTKSLWCDLTWKINEDVFEGSKQFEVRLPKHWSRKPARGSVLTCMREDSQRLGVAASSDLEHPFSHMSMGNNKHKKTCLGDKSFADMLCGLHSDNYIKST